MAEDSKNYNLRSHHICSYCWREDVSAMCGVCKHFLAAGKPCSIGERCDFSVELRCLSGTCQAARKPGERCQRDYECEGEAFCRAGVCSPTMAAGEPCEEDEEWSPTASQNGNTRVRVQASSRFAAPSSPGVYSGQTFVEAFRAELTLRVTALNSDEMLADASDVEPKTGA